MLHILSIADTPLKGLSHRSITHVCDPKSTKKHKCKQNAPPPADDEPAPIDIFVYLLIGYLEAYAWSVANKAFSHITALVQESTVDLILTVCDTSNNSCPLQV